uniref:Movement protein n=1 Tax=Ascaris lumbricoides TaxID=6252 RepID=A0A0M3IGQ2_ASCLU
MAFFDTADLIDAVRHEFGIDDESGLCAKILPRPSSGIFGVKGIRRSDPSALDLFRMRRTSQKALRRAKPGGLPLCFRQEDSYESDEEQYSPGYVAYFDEQSTRGIIDTRLRSKTNESDISSAAKAGISCSNVIVPGDFSDSAEMKSPCSDLIKYRNPSEVNNDFISRTSRLLKANPQTTVQTLAVYAKFESAVCFFFLCDGDIKRSWELFFVLKFGRSVRNFDK